MSKPPIAPKPRLVPPQRPLLPPSTLRNDDLSLPSPGTQRLVKPMVAPKPCLSKLGPALDSKTPTSKTLHQPPHREPQPADGPHCPQRDTHRETKKPVWDYVIPICLCSKETCRCSSNTPVNFHKLNGKTEDSTQLFPKSQRTVVHKIVSVNHQKLLQETVNGERILNADDRNGNVRPPVPHRTWSDEANGNMEPQDEPGRGPEEDVLGSEQASRPKPLSAGPARPVPVPRKLRTAVLTHQEKAEEDGEEITGRDGTETDVKEVKVLLEGKSISLPSAGAPVEKHAAVLSAGKACAIPDPPPRKKPLLSVPEKTSTSAPQTLPKDVEEEDLGWDGSGHHMQVSLDKGGKVAEEKERDGNPDRETADSHDACHLSVSRKPVSAEEGKVKVGPKNPQQPGSPMAWMSSNESSVDTLRDAETRQKPADVSRAFLTPAPAKPSRSSLSKHKSKSFSSADLIRSEGQRRNSFRKLLDLKLKMLPRLKTKADQVPGAAAAPFTEQSVDEPFIYEQKLPRPAIEVEQSVDADEDLYYENISLYEEIADYINVEVGSARSAPLVPATPSRSPFLQPPAWQSLAYDDEGIYEEPDPYISFERNADLQCPTPSDCER